MRVPIGVVFTIYESRPNVTADSAGLCLKTANAVPLKERLRNRRRRAPPSPTGSGAAVGAAGLPPAAVQLVTGGARWFAASSGATTGSTW